MKKETSFIARDTTNEVAFFNTYTSRENKFGQQKT